MRRNRPRSSARRAGGRRHAGDDVSLPVLLDPWRSHRDLGRYFAAARREIGLDHLLVERVDGDMLVMTSACLCCSIRGDLIASLEDILRRRDAKSASIICSSSGWTETCW